MATLLQSSHSRSFGGDEECRTRQLEAVFQCFAIRDDYCLQPYIPHCNVARAVRRAIGTYPPAGTVQQFLDEEVERSDTRRVTQSAFEYLCSLCEISGTMEASAEAQRAARAILRGRSAVPIEELREMVQQAKSAHEDDEQHGTLGNSGALTEQEFSKVIAELEKQSSEPMGECVSAAVVEHMLMGPSRHSSNVHSLHSTSTLNPNAAETQNGSANPHEDGPALLSNESSQYDYFPSAVAGGAHGGLSIALSDPSVVGGVSPEHGEVVPASHTMSTSDQISDVTVTPAAPGAATSPKRSPPQGDLLPPPAVVHQSTPKKEKSGGCCSVM